MHDIQVVADGKDFIQSLSIIAEFITGHTNENLRILTFISNSYVFKFVHTNNY